MILPFPPSLNRYYRHARGRTYISREGLAYRLAIQAIGLQSRRPCYDRPIKMDILVVLPDRRKHDLDNLQKALFDSMQAAEFFEDDNLIFDLHIVKRYKTPGEEGHLEVEIEPLAVVEAWRRKA